MIGQTDSKNIPSQVCRLNLRTFSANFSELKSSLRQFFRLLDEWYTYMGIFALYIGGDVFWLMSLMLGVVKLVVDPILVWWPRGYGGTRGSGEPCGWF